MLHVIVCPVSGLISLPTAVFSIYSQAHIPECSVAGVCKASPASLFAAAVNLCEYTGFRRRFNVVLHFLVCFHITYTSFFPYPL